MIQTVITLLIVAGALAFAVWRVVKLSRGKGGCNCSGCPYSGKKECHCGDNGIHLPEVNPDK